MNTNHPEIREGEVFLTNTNMITYKFKIYDAYDDITWLTKRKGCVAYDKNGAVINDVYPVFIQRKEYKDKYGDKSMNIALLNGKIGYLEDQNRMATKRIHDLYEEVNRLKIDRVKYNRDMINLLQENSELSGFVSGLQFHIEDRNAELKSCRDKVNDLNEELDRIKEATIRYHVKWHSGYNEILYGCGVDGIFKYLDAHPRKGDRIQNIVMMQ